MNKKQVIRLNESDLHRIVKESVNKVITELDWRTMASAAKKAKERGDDREGYFSKGATNAFNKAHSIDKTYDSDAINNGKEHSKLRYDIKPSGYDEFYYHSTPGTPRYKAPALNYHTHGIYNYDDNGNIQYGNTSDDGFYGDRVNGMPNYSVNYDDIKVRNKNDRELDNFYKGKSVYKQGKGWKQGR